MNTLGDLKARVRSLIGDADGDFCTDAYVTPLINQAYDQAINYLANTCSPFMTMLQLCPNLPAGTADLIEQQKPGSPLAGLMNPLEIEYKQAGQPETCYCFARRIDILPNVSPIASLQTSGWQNCGVWWEWRSYGIYVTPLPYAADFRVRGEYRPPPLIKDTDPLLAHPMMVVALAYATGALIGSERLNGTYVQNYGPAAEKALDDISAELVRQQQGTSSRVGRMGSRGRQSRGWNGFGIQS